MCRVRTQRLNCKRTIEETLLFPIKSAMEHQARKIFEEYIQCTTKHLAKEDFMIEECLLKFADSKSQEKCQSTSLSLLKLLRLHSQI